MECEKHTHSLLVDKISTLDRRGYPLKCVRCGEPGRIGDMTTQIINMGPSFNLGRCVCVSCWIRYSAKSEGWYCIQLSTRWGEDVGPCHHQVGPPDFVCSSEEHLPKESCNVFFREDEHTKRVSFSIKGTNPRIYWRRKNGVWEDP
jgi:hypothetical protein